MLRRIHKFRSYLLRSLALIANPIIKIISFFSGKLTKPSKTQDTPEVKAVSPILSEKDLNQLNVEIETIREMITRKIRASHHDQIMTIDRKDLQTISAYYEKIKQDFDEIMNIEENIKRQTGVLKDLQSFPPDPNRALQIQAMEKSLTELNIKLLACKAKLLIQQDKAKLYAMLPNFLEQKKLIGYQIRERADDYFVVAKSTDRKIIYLALDSESGGVSPTWHVIPYIKNDDKAKKSTEAMVLLQRINFSLAEKDKYSSIQMQQDDCLIVSNANETNKIMLLWDKTLHAWLIFTLDHTKDVSVWTYLQYDGVPYAVTQAFLPKTHNAQDVLETKSSQVRAADPDKLSVDAAGAAIAGVTTESIIIPSSMDPLSHRDAQLTSAVTTSIPANIGALVKARSALLDNVPANTSTDLVAATRATSFVNTAGGIVSGSVIAAAFLYATSLIPTGHAYAGAYQLALLGAGVVTTVATVKGATLASTALSYVVKRSSAIKNLILSIFRPKPIRKTARLLAIEDQPADTAHNGPKEAPNYYRTIIVAITILAATLAMADVPFSMVTACIIVGSAFNINAAALMEQHFAQESAQESHVIIEEVEEVEAPVLRHPDALAPAILTGNSFLSLESYCEKNSNNIDSTYFNALKVFMMTHQEYNTYKVIKEPKESENYFIIEKDGDRKTLIIDPEDATKVQWIVRDHSENKTRSKGQAPSTT